MEQYIQSLQHIGGIAIANYSSVLHFFLFQFPIEMAPYRERHCLQTRIMKYFEQMSTDSVYYRCLIDGNCIKPLNGKKKQNLVAHARTHREFFRENFETSDSALKDMPVRRLQFIQNCTEIVTVNKQPFSALNWSGFRKINKTTIETLTDAGYGTGLNPPKCRAVKSHIKYLSSEIVAQIKSEVNGKFVSLMVDSAKKFHRSILGINIQFMLGSEITIRSIGMIHLTSSHTAKNIAEVIFERMNSFGIKCSQLVSITTDNARNMTAMMNRFNEAFDEENAHGSDTDDSDGEDCNNARAYIPQTPFVCSNEGDLDAILIDVVQQAEEDDSDDLLELLDESPNFSAIFRELEEILSGQTININCIRCAAHTLQLAIMDALGITEFDLLIRLARAVCKQLRKESNVNELKEMKIKCKVPRIECDTRWNSIYLMVNKDSTYKRPSVP